MDHFEMESVFSLESRVCFQVSGLGKIFSENKLHLEIYSAKEKWFEIGFQSVEVLKYPAKIFWK